MPFGSTEFLGLQHSEFGPTIPALPSIDSFDAVPPVLSEEWSRLGKELSQCTGAEIVPRDNIHTALLLYGVRHEGNAVKQSPSGYLDDVNNNVKKLDSSLLLVGVRHDARTSALSALGDNTPGSPSGSNLSLSGLQKALSPGGLRRDVLRRSTSLPELTTEPQLLRECSFSTSASDEVAGGDVRSLQWNTAFFDPEAELLREPSPCSEPASALVASLFEAPETATALQPPPSTVAPVPRSPGITFNAPQAGIPEPLAAKENKNRSAATTPEPPLQGAPPATGATSPATSPGLGPASKPNATASKPAQPQKQAVQSLLQMLKPLQDHHKQLRQTQQGRGGRAAAEAAPPAGTIPADAAVPVSPATPPPALGIPMHSPIQQQATTTTRRHHRHHIVHISGQDSQPFQPPSDPQPQPQGTPSVVVLMPQAPSDPQGGPAMSPPRMAGPALSLPPAAAGGREAYAQQHMYAAGQTSMNACLVFPANTPTVGLPRTMM